MKGAGLIASPFHNLRRNRRSAALAGVGTSGALLAAVAVVFAAVTGLVAFSAWPDGPARAGEATMALAPPAAAVVPDGPPAPETTAPTGDDAPAPGAADAADGPAADGDGDADGGPARPAGRTVARDGTTGTGTGTGAPAAAVPQTGNGQSRDEAEELAAQAREESRRIGDAVAGGGAQAADGLTAVPPASTAVTAASSGVGAAVVRTGDAVADLLEQGRLPLAP